KGIEHEGGFKLVKGSCVGDIETVDLIPPQRSSVHQQAEMQKNQKECEQNRGREFAAHKGSFFRQESLHANRVRTAATNPNSKVIADKIDNMPPQISHQGRYTRINRPRDPAGSSTSGIKLR